MKEMDEMIMDSESPSRIMEASAPDFLIAFLNANSDKIGHFSLNHDLVGSLNRIGAHYAEAKMGNLANKYIFFLELQRALILRVYNEKSFLSILVHAKFETSNLTLHQISQYLTTQGDVLGLSIVNKFQQVHHDVSYNSTLCRPRCLHNAGATIFAKALWRCQMLEYKTLLWETSTTLQLTMQKLPLLFYLKVFSQYDIAEMYEFQMNY
ncbi:hypothetical protein WA026_009107 [Henosepilachna vigintioctopunctata]|uniref:Uncharacterized protein n=1 Tax=Henosepilachna vigintioctopunctata TaxID=420089 RepID=A0AAW1UYF8_9CUCU